MLCLVALGPPRLTTISIDESIMPSDQLQKEGRGKRSWRIIVPDSFDSFSKSLLQVVANKETETAFLRMSLSRNNRLLISASISSSLAGPSWIHLLYTHTDVHKTFSQFSLSTRLEKWRRSGGKWCNFFWINTGNKTSFKIFASGKKSDWQKISFHLLRVCANFFLLRPEILHPFFLLRRDDVDGTFIVLMAWQNKRFLTNKSYSKNRRFITALLRCRYYALLSVSSEICKKEVKFGALSES